MAYDDAGNFQNSISVSLGAGPYNDLDGATLQQYFAGVTLRYFSGSTNRLVITPASGGSTINSLEASHCSDGFTMLWVNNSATDNLIFNHLGGGTVSNQYLNANGASVYLAPLGSARCTYVVINHVGNWRFA